MDPGLRARRRRIERDVARRRLLAAAILAALGHVALVPLLILSFAHRPAAPKAPPRATFVELPAAAWDALRSGGPRVQARPADPAKPAAPKPPAPEPRPDREPPGQVVQTPPGNGQESPDARLAAESSNRAEKESIARDRDRAPAVTTPERQVAKVESEAPKREAASAGVVDGAGKDDRPRRDGKAAGGRLEIPSVDKRDQVALKADPTGPGRLAEREASEALEGNSDRLRLRLGPGDGDVPDASTGLPRGTGDHLTLFPSDDTVARITGAPFADHVEGVEEGEGTFLNTREWKYASFFNRVKRDVAGIWDPTTALRKRDPTGELFAWKDRLTVLRVVLDDGGRLRDVFVEKSSGVDFLDREAIRAFEQAQPFPNPPRGILDDHAQVSFSFGFFLDTTSRPGLQFFRVPR